MSASDIQFMRLALRLAHHGYGAASPNPMVGAVLVKGGKIIGRGWHRRAGLPHAEIEAIHDAQKRGRNAKGTTLYVTLEPCCTQGRTPPCTDAIIAAGVKRVVVGTPDPNPKHSGRAFKILRQAGIKTDWWGERTREPLHDKRCRDGSWGHSHQRQLAEKCARLNEAFNHWIVHRTPFVTVKAAMTLDGKIATATGESKWITGERARTYGMKLRQGADAILTGINTILADNPALTARKQMANGRWQITKPIRRIVLDSLARTPLEAEIANGESVTLTTIVVSKRAPENRVAALARRVNVIVAPVLKVGRAVPNAPPSARSENAPCQQIDLSWLLQKLGSENVTSLLVEGGGEVNASFLLGGFAQRVVFFYAPRILGGRDSLRAVAGEGVKSLPEALQLRDVEWKRIGEDLMMTARMLES